MLLRLRNALWLLNAFLALPLQLAVWLYQHTLSPDHGPLRLLFPFGYCRHHPTCSIYAREQLRTRWLPIALMLILLRIGSCHPWKRISDEKLRELAKNV